MERSLEIFIKQQNNVNSGDDRSLSPEYVGIEGNLIELPSTIEDSDKPSIIVDLFVMVDGNDSDEGNNTFYVVCNNSWMKIIQNRCDIRLVIPFNYSTDDRLGTVSFFHNIDTELVVNIMVHQAAHEYSVDITDEEDLIIQEDDVKKINLSSLDKNRLKFYVECTGGKNDFRIRKPKKFRIDKENDFTLPVTYDNAFELVKFKEEDRVGFELINHGNINCVYELEEPGREETPVQMKELVVDDYFYVVTINHINDVDTIDSLKIMYSNTGTDIPEIPIPKARLNAGNQSETVPNYIEPTESENEEEFEPSMTCDKVSLHFGPTRETQTIIVETIPEDSAIFFKKSGTFIDKAVVDGHEIRITVKDNPFRADRTCLCYIINAEYNELSIPITIKQDGTSTR